MRRMRWVANETWIGKVEILTVNLETKILRGRECLGGMVKLKMG
jgi:hypothetical protein